MRKWFFRVVALLLALGGIATAAVFLLASTESGTRWLVARAEHYFPAPLALRRVSGTLLSGLEIDQLTWRDEAVDVTVAGIEVRFELRPILRRHVIVNSLRTTRLHVVASSREDSPPDDAPLAVDIPLRVTIESAEIHDLSFVANDTAVELQRVSLKGTASGDDLRIDRLEIDSDWLQLDGRIRGQLAPPYRVDTQIEWQLQKLVPAPFAGNAEIKGDIDEYQVRHVLALPLAVESDGTVGVDENNFEFDLRNRWDAIEWPLDDTRMVVSRSGELRTSGSLDSYTAAGIALISVDGWFDGNVDIAAKGSLQHLEIGAIRGVSDWVSVAATGRVDWSGVPSFKGRFDVSDLDVGRFGDDLEGALNIAAQVSGRLPAGASPELHLKVDSVTGVVNGEPADAAFLLDMRDGAIDLADAQFTLGRNRLASSGRLAPDADLMLEWEFSEIAAFLPSATGRSKARLSVKRSADEWSAAGKVFGTALAWGDYSAESLELNGDVSNTATGAILAASGIQLDTLRIDRLDSELSGTRENHKIGVSLQAGQYSLSIRGDGAYDGGEWRGQLRQTEIRAGESSTWRNVAAVPVRIGRESAAVDVCLEELDSNSRICADAAYSKDGTARARATLVDLPLALMPLRVWAPGVDVRGAASADIDLLMEDGSVGGSASLQIEGASLAANYDGEELVATFERAVLRAVIDSNAVDAEAELELTEGGMATAAATLADITDPRSDVKGNVSAQITDLSFVPLLLPAISDTQGTVNGRLVIGGRLDEPSFGGDLRLDDGAFRVRLAGIRVSDINVQLRQGVDRRLSFLGTARSGEGQIKISGDSSFEPDHGLVTGVTISGDAFEFIRVPELHAFASPDIRVTLDQDALRVRGRLDIPRANATLNTLPETAERPSSDSVVHGDEKSEKSLARAVDIDVEAALGESVHLAGFGLDTRLQGELRLRGRSSQPYVATGRIDLYDGRYEAYGQELAIENGALIFSGPLMSPALDVRATRKVDSVTAGLDIRGTPDDLQSTVFSIPAMSDAEALSYLIAGRPLAVANDAESNRVGQAAIALGLSGADKVFAQVQNKLGLDSLSLDGDDEIGRIVAGRRIGGRLLVEYGYGLADRLGTLLLRYQLNDRIVVESTTGTASTLDVVYSVKKD